MKVFQFLLLFIFGLFTFSAQAQWTGAVNSDWNNAGNWVGGNIPTSADFVFIDPASNSPVISSTVTLYGIQINPGASLRISSNGTLRIRSFDPRLALLDNRGTVTNNGEITMISFASEDNGILNEGTFVNEPLTAGSGGLITISDISGRGIYNVANHTFESLGGTISIESDEEAILNDGTFLNETTDEGNGTINIDGGGSDGIVTSGIFTNRDAAINIGQTSTGITGSGIVVSDGNFSNLRQFINGSVTVKIDDTGGDGIKVLGDGSFSHNAGSITIGANDAIGNHGINNLGSFTSGSSITIARADESGIKNHSGATFNNNATISIGTQSAVGDHGVYNDDATFNNKALLQINKTTNDGIRIWAGGKFFNTANGNIHIGQTNGGSIGKFGIAVFENNSEFSNDNSTIRMDNTGRDGLVTESATTFRNINNAKIEIGQGAGNIGGFGMGLISSTGTFINNNSSIKIDNTAEGGLASQVQFTNQNNGRILIGQDDGNISEEGLNLGGIATFTNESNAAVTIDNVGKEGIKMESNAKLVNQSGAKIIVGQNGPIGSTTDGAIEHISNFFNPTIQNKGCAEMYLYDFVDLTVLTFTNSGFLFIDTDQTHAPSGNNPFANNGVINYVQDNLIPNVTNNDLIIAPSSSTSCAFANVLQKGASNNFDATATWYTNPAMNIAGGTYATASNTFTASSPQLGSNTYYFEVSGSGCTYGVQIDLTHSAISNTVKTWTGAVDTDWAVACNWSPVGIPTSTDDVVIPNVTNDPVIGNTTTAAVKSVMIKSTLAKLTINGRLEIDGSTGKALWNLGNVINNGTLDIGQNGGAATVGSIGIFNNYNFTNNGPGTINIDNTVSDGIFMDFGTFDNYGTINIGQNGGPGNIGAIGITRNFSDSNIFNNYNTANINIDNVVGSAIESTAEFNNAGAIKIGLSGAVNNIGLAGLFVGTSTFENEDGATIDINNTTLGALIFGIAGKCTNHGCAEITLHDKLEVGNNNNSFFKNEGLLTLNTSASHTITDKFTNDGVVLDIQGGFSGGTNNDLIIAPITLDCNLTDAIQIGGANSFTVLDEWFSDSGLSTKAGDYDQTENEFSPTDLSAGTSTLYFTATEGSCTYDASIEVTSTVAFPFTTFTWNGSVSSDWNDACNWMPFFVPSASDAVVIPVTSNDPIINGSTTAVAKSVVVETGATLTVQANSSLSIEGATQIGILVEGTLINSGHIQTGQTARNGEYGIEVGTGLLNNQVGGVIDVDNADVTGLYINTGLLDNFGTINIGQNESFPKIRISGITVFDSLHNAGTINIDKIQRNGITVTFSGGLSNAGNILIGQNHPVDRTGLVISKFGNMEGYAENLSNGTIIIDKVQTGIDIEGSFINSGIVKVAENSTPVLAIFSENQFINNTCGEIFFGSRVSNAGGSNFLNAGFIVIDTDLSHNNSGTITNNGLIEYRQLPLLSNVTNNEIIIAPTQASVCGAISSAFDLGAMVDFNILGIFTDENATVAAGTYDVSTNTFIATTALTPGSNTFYVKIEGPVNNCESIAEWTVEATAVDVVWTGAISSDWNDAGNWNPHVPLACDNVIIPETIDNEPIIDGATAAVAKSVTVEMNGFLIIENGGSLDVNGAGGDGISVSGDVDNSGTINIGQSLGVGGHGMTINPYGTFFNEFNSVLNIGNTTDNGMHILDDLTNFGQVTNYGNINIGQGAANIGGEGIYNSGDFSHLSGMISVDNANENAIYLAGSSSMANESEIYIGQNGGNIGANGIRFADGDFDFTNFEEGIIKIDNVGNHGMYSPAPGTSAPVSGNFIDNFGTMFFGQLGGISNQAINLPFGNFQNRECALIRVFSDNVIQGANTITNRGLIIVKASGTSHILENEGVVVNLKFGTFNITINSGTFSNFLSDLWTGCVNSDWNNVGNWFDGTVPTALDNVIIPIASNDPVIMNGTSAVAKSVYMDKYGELDILSGGSLSIDGSANTGLTINGKLTNNGELNIGQSTAISGSGISCTGTLINSSIINIDNVGGSGLEFFGILLSTTSFVNNSSGTVNIGQNSGNIGATGLFISSTRDIENNGGLIQIDYTGQNGVNIFNADFTNKNNGQLLIGERTGNIGGHGLYSDCNSFSNIVNEDHSVIQISKTNLKGIDNKCGQIVNSNGSQIVIGKSGPIGKAAYSQKGLTTSSILNDVCSELIFYDKIETNGAFTNNGLLTLDTDQAHSNTGTITNNGIIEYRQLPLIPNVVNNEIIIAPSSGTNCGSLVDVFDLGTMVDFDVLGIFTDANATISAGTYDQATNTFTPSVNLSTFFINTFYVKIEDPINGCESIVEWTLDISTSTVTWTGNNGTDWNNAANWDIRVPLTCDNVIIPDVTNDPVIDGATTAHVKSVEVQASAMLEISLGGSLTISGTGGSGLRVEGTVSNNGTIDIHDVGFAAVHVFGNGTFNNNGLLNIGQTGGADNVNIGIINLHDINNNAGATINIDNTFWDGIQNDGGSFRSWGTLNIGQFGGDLNIGNVAFVNEGHALNESGGTIRISEVDDRAINNQNTFDNFGTIDIGQNGTTDDIGSNGILNESTFNHEAGQINIDAFRVYGISNGGTFTNKATIIIGATVANGGSGIGNSANFINESGTIKIDRCSSHGIDNIFGDFINKANIQIGQIEGPTLFGINNELSSFINEPGGNLLIDDTSLGILNSSASTFTNQANIELGGNANVGDFAIYNEGNFNHESGATSIDRFSNAGIKHAGGTFTNEADIQIGTNTSGGNYGIENYAAFNHINGTITANGMNQTGIYNGGNFTSYSKIQIGNLTSPGFYGIQNGGGTFDMEGDTISIDRSTSSGVNNSATINNEATLLIGEISSPGNHGINNNSSSFNNRNGGKINICNTAQAALLNEDYANFRNLDCSHVHMKDNLLNLNGASIINNGFLTIDASDVSTPEDFTNNGIVADIQGTLPINGAGFMNNEIVVAPSIGDCNDVLDAFALGPIIDYNILGIFTDENATLSAGTYNGNTNTFSPTTGLGQLTLYVQIENPAEGCTKTIPWSVAVGDNTPPVLDCVGNLTVELDVNGTYTFVENEVFNGGTDDCGTVGFVSMSPEQVDCSNINNPVIVTVTANDGNGNENTCTSTVTVEDNIDPTPTCLNPTVVLDASGSYVIQQSDVLGNSNDNCPVINLWDAVPSSFDCSDAGTVVPVTVTIYDSSNNPATCTANVTVEDNQNPLPACLNPTVSLNASGTHSLTESEVFVGGTDNCGLVTFVNVSPSVVDCDNVSGPISVIVTAQDASGNQNTCTATVTVTENVLPVATCQDLTIELIGTNASIIPAQVDNGSTDNCAVDTLELDVLDFGCADVGANTVNLTVTDINGNSADCTATVNVEDNEAPVAQCKAAPIAVTLNTSGEHTVDPTNLDDGSSDACGIQSLSASPALLDCSNEGANTITLTVTDNNGNTSTCTAIVEVAPFFSIGSIMENAETCTGMGDGSIIIEASASGGQIGYSIDGGSNFQFGNTFTSLTPDTYNIVVKIFGINAVCEKTATATIEAGTQSQTWYRDMDGDQYSDGTTTTACSQPAGYYLATDLLATSGDCNDSDPDEHPGQTWYEDLDGDGHSSGNTLTACQRPIGSYTATELTATSGDCDDGEATVHPGATEICNGIDDDCDGEIDEGTSGGLTFTGNVAFYTQAAVDAFSQCHSIIDGNVTILGTNITDLSNLSNIEEITGSLTIQTTGLTSMNGLGNLVEVGGTLTIYFNSSLTNLDGLDVLGAVGGNLSVYYNFTLSDGCAIYDLINGGVNGSTSIFLNASGCNSVAEINANCGANNLVIDPDGQVNPLSSQHNFTTRKELSPVEYRLFPNPATSQVTLEFAAPIHHGRIQVSDVAGRLVFEQIVSEDTHQVSLNLSDREPGTYFISINTPGKQPLTKRLILIDNR